MSIFWKTDHFGYDGDQMHGNITVNYWQGQESVEAELDEQIAMIRKAMLDEYPRLSAHEDDE